MALKFKILFVLLIFTSFVNLCYAQSDVKRNKKILKQAETAFERADFLRAYNLYSEGLKHDSANYDAIYKSGLCLFNINKTDTGALKFFLKSKEKIADAHFYLGEIYQMKSESEKALQEFFYYKTINKEEIIPNKEVENWIKKCETAIKEAAQKENYVVKNIGRQINTKYPEYVPLIWDLNGSLVFTSRREDSKGGLVDPYGKFYEDIYISNKTNEGWSKPVSLSDNLNTDTHDACVAFSPAGNELIIYRTDEKKTGGNLYISKYDSSKWSLPVKLGPEINSEYLEASACFSAYGNEIIFSSNRPGGYGGKDLYRVVRFLNGNYSLPLNLGPGINTTEDEDAPFLDKNDNTLYFGSKGHNTMGEYDIFKAGYDTENNNWINVENLGQPINSTNDDIYFIKEKNLGYFTSRREGGYGDADIYEVNFAESSKVIVYCRINAENINKEELENFQLSLYDIKTGKLEGLYIPNKNYMNVILLATKDQLYEMKIEGGNIDTILKQVSFNENNKEITIDLVKNPDKFET